MLALQSTASKSSDFILDALPYIDDVQYDDSHRKFALKLIEDEQKRYPMTKDYLRRLNKPAFDKFLTPVLQTEFQRMSDGKPMPEFDSNRYMVPQPGTSADRNAWLNAVKNCGAQIEHSRLRKLNLELMQDHGSASLLKMNRVLQNLAEREEQSVYKLRSRMFDIHSRRKRKQEEVGSQLMQMGSQWIVLVNKNIQLDDAILSLETEVKATAKRLKIEYDYEPPSRD